MLPKLWFAEIAPPALDVLAPFLGSAPTGCWLSCTYYTDGSGAVILSGLLFVVAAVLLLCFAMVLPCKLLHLFTGSPQAVPGAELYAILVVARLHYPLMRLCTLAPSSAPKACFCHPRKGGAADVLSMSWK